MTELPAPRLTCREVVSLLADYLEDVLAPPERARVEEHLQTCPDCGAYVHQFRTTIGVLGRLREENVPQPILDELVETFRGWRPED